VVWRASIRNTVMVTMSAEQRRPRPGLLDVAEGLLELGIEIAGQRLAGVVHLSGVAGDPDDAAGASVMTQGENARLICQVPRTNDFCMDAILPPGFVAAGADLIRHLVPGHRDGRRRWRTCAGLEDASAFGRAVASRLAKWLASG
jgi:hypothetical protein